MAWQFRRIAIYWVGHFRNGSTQIRYSVRIGWLGRKINDFVQTLCINLHGWFVFLFWLWLCARVYCVHASAVCIKSDSFVSTAVWTIAVCAATAASSLRCYSIDFSYRMLCTRSCFFASLCFHQFQFNWLHFCICILMWWWSIETHPHFGGQLSLMWMLCEWKSSSFCSLVQSMCIITQNALQTWNHWLQECERR